MQDYARAMYREAMGRLNDAEILSRAAEAQSDSDALLRILGFEVLLKCALVLCGKPVRRSHCYTDLWADLPDEARGEILNVAQHHLPGLADLSDLGKLLSEFRHTFEKARYYYEFYEKYTEAERQREGELWLRDGRAVDDAVIRYYSVELICLVEGLQSFCGARLGHT